MATVTFVTHGGLRRTCTCEAGTTLMEVAMRDAVPGIDANCGGARTCATCHVYVRDSWFERTGPRDETEEDMLDFALDVRPNSRLSCCLKITEDLDGLVVDVPERQA